MAVSFPTRRSSDLSAFFLLVAAGDAQICVATQSHVFLCVVRVLVDLEVLRQIRIGCGLFYLLFRLAERQRLLGLEDRLGRPGGAAGKAGHGVFGLQIIEARPAFRTGPLVAPFSSKTGSAPV